MPLPIPFYIIPNSQYKGLSQDIRFTVHRVSLTYRLNGSSTLQLPITPDALKEDCRSEFSPLIPVLAALLFPLPRIHVVASYCRHQARSSRVMTITTCIRDALLISEAGEIDATHSFRNVCAVGVSYTKLSLATSDAGPRTAVVLTNNRG